MGKPEDGFLKQESKQAESVSHFDTSVLNKSHNKRQDYPLVEDPARLNSIPKKVKKAFMIKSL